MGVRAGRHGISRFWVLLLAVAASCICVSLLDEIGSVSSKSRNSTYAAESGEIRVPAKAGQWYPSDPDELRIKVMNLLDEAPASASEGHILALIAPHAGYQFSGKGAAAAFRAVKDASYSRVIVIGPTHNFPFRGVGVPSKIGLFRTPLGDIPIDTATCRDMLSEEPFVVGDVYHGPEHSLEAELPFLQVALKPGWKLVPLVVGQIDGKMADVVASILKNMMTEDTLFVVSTDFCHYGRAFDFVPFTGNVPENLRALDMGAADLCVSKNNAGFAEYCDKTGATICGRNGVRILLAALPETAKGTLLQYYTSGDLTTDYKHCVSYVAISYSTQPEALPKGEGKMTEATQQQGEFTPEERKKLVALARESLNKCVVENKRLLVEPKDWPEKFRRPCGAFVTLTKHGDLRGCIGYVEPRYPLVQTIADNALNAAREDPRFPRVQPPELKDIEIEISVMTPLREVKDVKEIVVGKHGLVIEKGWNRGLLLPQVATAYGWDRETFLQHTCRKAGLPPDAWKQGSKILCFSAEVFGEKDFEKEGESK
ncbi:MAG TPA: AmmeMemoRadiSam system protein B [Candidatus Brocadiia bacterium]|nr:AmmeMemoRadiSam system protein B [Candidatus Brocadiia bacterium]